MNSIVNDCSHECFLSSCDYCVKKMSLKKSKPSEMFSEIINAINEDVKDIEVVRKYLKSYNKKFNEKFKNIHIEHLTECNQYLKKIEDLLNNYPVQNHLIRDSLKQIDEINDKIKNQLCSLCKEKIATTTEHIFKNSLLEKKQPKEKGEKFHKKNGKDRKFTNSKSLINGQKKDLCENCNNIKSKKADSNFKQMILDVYEFLVEKHRLEQDYTNNTSAVNQGLKMIPEESRTTDSIIDFIYSFSTRECIIVNEPKWDETEIKRYFAKLIATQIGWKYVPRDIRSIFLEKNNLNKINYKIYNVQYNFNSCDTIFNKSNVLAEDVPTKTAIEEVVKKIQGYQKVSFELTIGPLAILIDYGGLNLEDSQIYKLYDNDPVILEQMKLPR